MPKVTEEHRMARKRQIGAAAALLFATKGIRGTSMSDIIEASGLSAGAIYGHYKSKDDLIKFAITDLLDERVVRITDALAAGPIVAPGEAVRLFLNGMEDELGEVGIVLQVWAQAALDPGMRGVTDLHVEKFRDLFYNYLVEWYTTKLGLDAAQADRGARELAVLYVGIMQGYVVQSAIHSSFDGEAYLAAASAIRPDFRVAH